MSCPYREHFAVLLGKTHKIDGYTMITVIDLLFPEQSDYNQQSVAFLRIKKDFIHQSLVELTNSVCMDYEHRNWIKARTS